MTRPSQPPSPRWSTRRKRALLGSSAIIGLTVGLAYLSDQGTEVVPEIAEVADKDCPKDAQRVGSAPPQGTATWCEKADGTRHGPFLSWYANGQERERGTYTDGSPTGKWNRFSQDGRYRVGTVEPAIQEIGSQKFRMIRIDPGKTAIGTRDRHYDFDKDHTRHHVEITKAFLLGATEVTQGLWEEVTGENPTASRCPGAGIGEHLPVACVSFVEAARFANLLSRKERRKPAYTFLKGTVQWVRDATGYRLPTNAEWEYAAQAGDQTRFAGTDESEMVCRYGNVDSWGIEGEGKGKFRWSKGACLWGDFRDEKPFMCEDDHPGRADVASFRPNRWGLFDMTGNVSEWVWDRSERYDRDPQTDPSGPAQARSLSKGRAYSGKGRVFRGGGWDTCPRRSQLHFRSVCPENVWACRGPRPLEVGLRLARSVI